VAEENAEFNRSEKFKGHCRRFAEKAEKSKLGNVFSVFPPPLRVSALRTDVRAAA
jgi:hypothetical protein